MTRIGAVLISAALLSCGAARVDKQQAHPNLTFPAKTQRDSSAAQPAASSSAASTPADPPQLSSTDHWQLELSYARGVIRVTRALPLRYDEPHAGKRHTGRFALELWSRDTLLDRLRFDFPLLAADAAPSADTRPLHREATFAPGAEVTATLQAPSVSEITRAQIVDRTTGQVTPLSWPPSVQPAPAAHPPGQ